MNCTIEKAYTHILEEELVLALGCTEPSAIAYCAAKATEVLGIFPEKIVVKCSGNMIKNVKGVVVPNSGGLKGITAAATLGCFATDSSKALEVLNQLTNKEITAATKLINTDFCTCELQEGEGNLYIAVTATNGKDKANVVIRDSHTNIILIEKNNEIIYKKNEESSNKEKTQLRDMLTIDGIIDYAKNVNLSKDITDLLDVQINSNCAIAEEGLINDYGACVGKTIKEYRCQSTENNCIAKAAAAADARMNGSIMPVVINSGSGNQGITVTVPVVEYAKTISASKEQTYRALLISNLVAIHIKSNIGKLSAFCGAISAAASAGAAICFLENGTNKQIGDTLVNALNDASGVICDGAKASCAAKIATGLDAAFLGCNMALKNNVFAAGEGLVSKDLETTISFIGRLGKDGMKETDVEILKMMLEN